MKRCKVCGKILKLKKEYKYLINDTPVGLNCLVEKSKIYECFDCPKCGCQNIVNVREGNEVESISTSKGST